MPTPQRWETFTVDGIKCEPSRKGDVINCGRNAGWPRSARFVVARRVNEDHKEAVVRMLADLNSCSAKQRDRVLIALECAAADVAGVRLALSEEQPQVVDSDMFGNVDVFMESAEFSAGTGDADQWRSRRVSQPVKRLLPCDADTTQLRGHATGARKKRKSAVDDGDSCTKPSCVQEREEHARLKIKYDEQSSGYRKLRDQLDQVCDGLEPHDAMLMRHIQHALMELLDETDDDINGSTIGDNTEATGGEAENGECEPEMEDEANEGGANGDQHHVVANIGAALASSPGTLAISSDELLWAELGASSPSLRIPLADVNKVSITHVR